MSSFRAINPANGQLITSRPEATPAQVDAALAQSDAAFREWSNLGVAARTPFLRKLGDRLKERAADDARILVEEMGKPYAQAKAEIEKCAFACHFAADHAEQWLAPQSIATEAKQSFVRHEPMGSVLAIMPWNFPYWQLFRFGASALASGNAIVLKHAPNVPQCAEAIVEIFSEAGLPPGLIVNLFAPVSAIEGLIADSRIAAITLTGSTRAGQSVAALGAKYLKPSVLELGGSDPFIVLADADLEAAATIASKARLQNNGQSCIAAKRFIVEKGAEEFIDRFRAKMAATRQDDPLLPETELGPMARADLRDELHAQVAASIAAGGQCLLGGEVPQRDGWWYPATLVANAAPGMPVWDAETFGPAAAVRVVQDAQEAVAVANASPFGLGASVWTADRQRAAAMASKLVCGAVFVNDLVRSDPRMPFGGTKTSGWGRELGIEGMRAFTATKSVWIA